MLRRAGIRVAIGTGVLAVAGAAIVTSQAPSADDGEDASAVAQARPVAFASEERVDNAWPVGGEWRYEASWATPTDLHEGQYDLYQRGIDVCMSDAGFDYVPYEFFDSDAVYGQLNPLYEDGLSLGYEEPQQPDPEAGSPNSRQSEDFMDTLLAPEGCANRSLALVYGNPAAEAFTQLQGTMIASVDRAVGAYATTPDYQQRSARWSSCMAAAGFDLDDPLSVSGSLSGEEVVAGDGVVSDREEQIRRADYDCDLSADLTESRSRWESAAFASWLDDNAADVRALNELQAEAQRELTDISARLSEEGIAALPSIDDADSGETTASTLPN